MADALTAVAKAVGLHPNLVGVLAAIFAALTAGTILRVGSFAAASRDDEKRAQRLASLATWWTLFLLLAAVVWLGPRAVVLLLAITSLAGLREYSRLAGSRVAGRRLWWWAALSVPVHYLIVYYGPLGAFWTFIPVWVLGVLLVHLVVAEETEGFLESAGIVFLGLMVLVYLLSHAGLIVSLPLVGEDVGAGAMGLFVYLILLTETNDIAQALWGRRFGRHKITPRVSPHKTWEGFLAGALTTVILAIALAGVLTNLDRATLLGGNWQVKVEFLPAAIAGVLIAVGGFLGDTTMSAIKREMGVKDSGALLPGQGGVLDRIDSLIFTAPLFFYFVYVFCDY